MVFLSAFLTFLIFITTLIGLGSLVMGSIYRNRSLIFFGLKALLIAIVAVTIIGVLLPHMKDLGAGFKKLPNFYHL